VKNGKNLRIFVTTLDKIFEKICGKNKIVLCGLCVVAMAIADLFKMSGSAPRVFSCFRIDLKDWNCLEEPNLNIKRWVVLR
jgi:hypothetical protein